MNQILVCTHGNTGIEIVNSVEMIMGPQNNLVGIQFDANESIEDLTNRFKQYFDKEKDTLILVDIVGGTPFNVSTQFAMRYPQTAIVSGVHIGMLIELCYQRDQSLEKLADFAVEIGRKYIQKKNPEHIEDEEF